jgi:MFS family permease
MARSRSEDPDTRAFAADEALAGGAPPSAETQPARAESLRQEHRPITPLYRTVCIKQLLLPIQVGLLAPTQTNTAFAVVSSLGALAGLLAAPITGALSDRTTSRWGRRRPWVGVGILVGLAGLLLMALAPNIPLLLVGEILEQLGVDAVLANVTALIPDQIPQRQQATMAALNGMAPVVGGVLGLVLVTSLTNPRVVEQGYLLLALFSCLFVATFLCLLREPPLARGMVSPFHLRTFLASFLRPLTSRDFVFTLLSRLMVFLAFTLLGSYLLFYLRARLHASIESAAHGVTTFQLISTAVLIAAALLASLLSRRLHRLKAFVILGALLMAAGLGTLVVSPTWTALWISAAIFGTGFGSYLGLDIALAVRVLPRADESGKDLGIIYTAIFLPLMITPVLGAFILNVFQENFAVLFSVAAVASVCAALLILPVRAVR